MKIKQPGDQDEGQGVILGRGEVMTHVQISNLGPTLVLTPMDEPQPMGVDLPAPWHGKSVPLVSEPDDFLLVFENEAGLDVLLNQLQWIKDYFVKKNAKPTE